MVVPEVKVQSMFWFCQSLAVSGAGSMSTHFKVPLNYFTYHSLPQVQFPIRTTVTLYCYISMCDRMVTYRCHAVKAREGGGGQAPIYDYITIYFTRLQN